MLQIALVLSMSLLPSDLKPLYNVRRGGSSFKPRDVSTFQMMICLMEVIVRDVIPSRRQAVVVRDREKVVRLILRIIAYINCYVYLTRRIRLPNRSSPHDSKPYQLQGCRSQPSRRRFYNHRVVVEGLTTKSWS